MNNQRLLDTFLELVQIDSPSKYEAAVAAYCTKALEAAGATVTVDDSASKTGSDTGNLIATLPGTVASASSASSAIGTTNAASATDATTTTRTAGQPGCLYFSAHMDCVEPCRGVKPIIEDGIIQTNGQTILGGDDKVGVAAIIELVRSLAEDSKPHPEIKVLLSVQEEVGLVGAKAYDFKSFSDGFCYVLDAAGKPGLVVNGAPYQQSYYASYQGVAAHAGIAPEAGVSAIKAAARAVTALPQGRIDQITTTNVGMIQGGAANNIVPEDCRVQGEFRSHDQDKLLALRQQIEVVLTEAAGDTQLKIEWEVNYDGFCVPEDAPVVKLALEAATKLGLPASCEISGGGADTNIFAANGLATVSLGCGMDKVHSTKEYLAIKDLEDVTKWAIQIAYDFVA